MSGVGQVAKLEMDETLIVIPEDMELNFWSGGIVVTDMLQNQGSVTPVKAFRAGCITGITARTARVGAYKQIVEILQKSADNAVGSLVELANGEKWSAPVIGKWDSESFFSTSDGKMAFAIYAEDGYFNQV